MTLSAALPWIIFTVFVLGVLALDLGVFHRKSHAVTVKEATAWTAVWVTLALIFNVGIYYFRGHHSALEFLTGYLIEYSLSVDNIFVFVLIFTAFRVPAVSQHRVLFWGILGAFVMRGIMIGVGAALIHRFEWIIYIFGAFLIYTGIKIAFQKEEEAVHIGDNPLVKFVRKHFRMTPHYVGDHFVVRDEATGARLLTPMVLVLIVIETTDLIFAVDSIPAIFAVTTDAFIVYTSNVFAILGLRSLYFLLAGIIDRFYYLKPALSFILTFVGVKMVISHWYKIPIYASLAVIVGALLIAVIASMIRARKLGALADTAADPRDIPAESDIPEEFLREGEEGNYPPNQGAPQ